jgi:uncharacterized membrane protein
MFYGVWVYSILCLILVLLYGYYTEIFDIKLFDYSLSFWTALIVNLVLLSTSIISLKGPKVLPILGIISMPVSIYLFYTSWTEKNSLYLTGFMAIPVILLLISIIKRRQKYPVTEQ